VLPSAPPRSDSPIAASYASLTEYPQSVQGVKGYNGFSEWTELEKFWEVRDILSGVLGPERVLISQTGFNAVGKYESVTPSGGSAAEVE